MAANHGGFSAGSPAKNHGANGKIREPIGLATTGYRPDLYETFGENSMGGAASTRLRELLGSSQLETTGEVSGGVLNHEDQVICLWDIP